MDSNTGSSKMEDQLEGYSVIYKRNDEVVTINIKKKGMVENIGS